MLPRINNQDTSNGEGSLEEIVMKIGAAIYDFFTVHNEQLHTALS